MVWVNMRIRAGEGGEFDGELETTHPCLDGVIDPGKHVVRRRTRSADRVPIVVEPRLKMKGYL